jgi:hypothetical protein
MASFKDSSSRAGGVFFSKYPEASAHSASKMRSSSSYQLSLSACPILRFCLVPSQLHPWRTGPSGYCTVTLIDAVATRVLPENADAVNV